MHTIGIANNAVSREKDERLGKSMGQVLRADETCADSDRKWPAGKLFACASQSIVVFWPRVGMAEHGAGARAVRATLNTRGSEVATTGPRRGFCW